MLKSFTCCWSRLLLANAKERWRAGIIHETDWGKSVSVRAETQYQCLYRMAPTVIHGIGNRRRQWCWKITQPPHGTRECYISVPAWERNSSSCVVCFFKIFLEHWSRCREKNPIQTNQLTNKKPKPKWFDDCRKCCAVRPSVNSCSLFLFIRKVERGFHRGV